MCWGSVPAVHLKMILACIEKIAFSALSLKVLLEPGKREVARWKMLQLSEFVTGIDKEKVRIAVRNTAPWPCLIATRHVDAASVTCLQSVGCIVVDARRVHTDELERVHRDQQTGVTECFDTRLDAHSADSKNIHLIFSEQRAHFYVPTPI